NGLRHPHALGDLHEHLLRWQVWCGFRTVSFGVAHKIIVPRNCVAHHWFRQRFVLPSVTPVPPAKLLPPAGQLALRSFLAIVNRPATEGRRGVAAFQFSPCRRPRRRDDRIIWPMIAVGTLITERPPHRSARPNSGIRLVWDFLCHAKKLAV